jgi:hypothetical protein
MPPQASNSPLSNPALWLMIVIPATTVIASFITLGLAIQGADAELPKSYATEGSALDADLALLTTAKQLGVKAFIDVERSGIFRARVQSASGETFPSRLSLTLTHVVDASRDKKVDLVETAEVGVYAGDLDTDLEGRWLVQLDHESVWRLRGRAEVPATGLLLGE